jgi:hypothetical protein
MRAKCRFCLQKEPDIAEMHFGAWEGQRWDDIARSELDAWTEDFAHYRCGSGSAHSGAQSGESVHELLQRVARVLVQSTQHSQLAWLTHAGVIRAVQWLLAQEARSMGTIRLLAATAETNRSLAAQAGATRSLASSTETAQARRDRARAPALHGLRASDWPMNAPHFGQRRRVSVPSLVAG